MRLQLRRHPRLLLELDSLGADVARACVLQLLAFMDVLALLGCGPTSARHDSRASLGWRRRWRKIRFGFGIGEDKIWVHDLLLVCDPNHGMGLVFGYVLLEIVL